MNKVLEVILKLNDQFTAPLRQSETGLQGFSTKMQSMVSNVVSFAALSAAIYKAFEALDGFRVAALKLEGTAKITGVALGDLTDLANKAQKQFGLSRSQAADFAVEMAKLASKAGDVGAAAPALQKFLDIGAARGLTAEQTLKAVQQAILGIDEGTDKLFNKNPSVLYKEFADSIGTTAAKLTDQQKAQALLTAATQDGGKVVGAYGDYLGTTAGQIQLTKNRTQEFYAVLGELLDPLRQVFYRIIEGFANIGIAAVQGWEMIGATLVAGFQNLPNVVMLALGKAAMALGDWAGQVAALAGPLSGVFTQAADSVAMWGVKTVTSSRKAMKEVTDTWTDRMLEIQKIQTESEEELTRTVRKQGGIRTVLTGDETGARVKAIWTVAEINAEAERQTRATWLLSSDFILEQVNRVVKAQKVGADVAKAAWDTILDGMDGVYGSSVKTAGAIEKVDNNTVNAARGAISLAREFGAIDENAASVLNNVVNLADTLSNIGEKVGAGDLVSIIGASVGILNGLFNGNPAHMALIRKNIDSLEELTRSNGLLLRAQSTGAKVAAAKEGLAGFEDIAKIVGTSAGINATRFQGFRGLLQSLGLTMGDAEQIAKDMGIDLGIENGGISQGAVQAFVDGLKTANFGKVGDTFADRTDFLDRYFKVAGISDPALQAAFIADAIKEDNAFLADLLKKYDVNTVEGREGLRAEFVSIMQRMQNGTFDSSLFGNLSGADFLGFIESFTDLMGNIGSGFASGVGIGGGAVTGASFSGVTFATGSYDLGVKLFDPIGRMDTNLAEAVSILRDIRAINISIGTINGGDPAAFRSAALDAINEALAAERDLSSASEG